MLRAANLNPGFIRRFRTEVNIAYRTDVGKTRMANEDAVLTLVNSDNNIFVCAVADGMGGHKGGGTASATALNILRRRLIGLDGKQVGDYIRSLEEIVHDINDEILQRAKYDRSLQGMGSTITACIIHKDQMIVFHIGDSRLYVLHNHELRQVTKDHSLVQRLVDEGRLTQDEAATHPNRNILLKALGSTEHLTADILEVLLPPGAKILLCSDGLTTMVDDNQIKEILENNTYEAATDKLITAANNAGGLDNITVIICDAGETM